MGPVSSTGGASGGRFEPLLELGQGGMGTAYLARAVGIGGFERLVVVKRLNPHLLDQPDATRRFIDEARVAAYVHHANVVGVQQAGQDEHGHYIVLDFVEGASLDDLVDRAVLRQRRLPVPIALRIALDALTGLQAIHTARDAAGTPLNILHRDVSPQNVLVGRDGVSRVADFGIAKSRLASVSTDKAYLVGKLLYMPPEYLRREAVGPSLDVYGLGLTLWVALAAEDPWPDADEAQLLTHIFTDGVPSLAERIGVPPQVDAIVARACAGPAAERYASAQEMADAIEALGRETGWLASHAEVARFVEEVMGVDLVRRRERIAELMSASTGRPSVAPPVAVEGRDADLGTATTGVLALTVTKEKRRRRSRVTVAAVAVAAGVAAVGAALAFRGSDGSPPQGSAGAGAATEGSARKAESAEVGEAETVTSAAAAEPEEEVTERAVERGGGAAPRPAPAQKPAPGGARQPTPARARPPAGGDRDPSGGTEHGAGKGGRAQEPVKEEGITTRNPYR